MFKDLEQLYDLGMKVVVFIGACGLLSAIKDGTFFKYPYRMFLSSKDIAKGELMRDMIKEAMKDNDK